MSYVWFYRSFRTNQRKTHLELKHSHKDSRAFLHKQIQPCFHYKKEEKGLLRLDTTRQNPNEEK